MAPTMAITQPEIDAQVAAVAALNAAIDDGVRQVTIRGQTTTYNTTASLIVARDDAVRRLRAMRAELAEGTPPPQLRLYYYADRGYD